MVTQHNRYPSIRWTLGRNDVDDGFKRLNFIAGPSHQKPVDVGLLNEILSRGLSD